MFCLEYWNLLHVSQRKCCDSWSLFVIGVCLHIDDTNPSHFIEEMSHPTLLVMGDGVLVGVLSEAHEELEGVVSSFSSSDRAKEFTQFGTLLSIKASLDKKVPNAVDLEKCTITEVLEL